MNSKFPYSLFIILCFLLQIRSTTIFNISNCYEFINTSFVGSDPSVVVKLQSNVDCTTHDFIPLENSLTPFMGKILKIFIKKKKKTKHNSK